ncbi:hypothetical protein JYU13_00270 [Gammaproteobacteria bacterium AH-315-M22]|nr:hypothetical protein [Gammaproteobacteria bacterium AH-315-M22]
MNDEQRSMAALKVQPEGLSLFFCPAALSLAYVEPLHYAYSALLGKKTGSAGRPY